jgi:UDPglucose 6-dehydrogenase
VRISIVGTGYVGLVTGVCLADIGHEVTCIDIDESKVEKMRQGISPIYEPGLEDLMKKNIAAGRLNFHVDHKLGFGNAEVIFIAVGTPQREDGSADLSYVTQAAIDIARNITNDVIIITKSTVPVGTNEYIKKVVLEHLIENDTHNKIGLSIKVASNPEFLREGSAIHDTFYGDRIVIGADNEETAKVIEEIYKPFNIPVFKTDIRSAEIIKYASNSFLATKISFINEIANLCESVGANVEDVADGMGLDKRIGNLFLNAGIGYGGSCFPKDTHALVNIAEKAGLPFDLIKSVIRINKNQQELLVKKAKRRFESLKGKKCAVLGLAFKPNTDDMREAASITITKMLQEEEAVVVAYDPIAMDNAKRILPAGIIYAANIEEAVKDADMLFLVTEWDEFKSLDLNWLKIQLNEPIIFDGRNMFEPKQMEQLGFEYHSIGRASVGIKKHLMTTI